MGLLVQPSTGAERALSARTLVGRSPACTLRIDDGRVSGEHASLWFRGGCWWVRDLGSRNGTRVDSELLPPGQERALAVGSTLIFGGLQASAWTLSDAGPPRPRARELGGDARVDARGGVLILPPGESPELSVIRQQDGTWFAEGDADRYPVEDGATVVAGDRAWRLLLPTALDPTALERPDLEVRFAVSADEESVAIEVVLGEARHAMPSRSENYLLLLLARHRLNDLRQGVELAEQGWIQRSALARMLAVRPRTVNVQLHRLRQRLGEVEDGLAGRLLEVRGTRTGQVRIGTHALSEQAYAPAQPP